MKETFVRTKLIEAAKYHKRDIFNEAYFQIPKLSISHKEQEGSVSCCLVTSKPSQASKTRAHLSTRRIDYKSCRQQTGPRKTGWPEWQQITETKKEIRKASSIPKKRSGQQKVWPQNGRFRCTGVRISPLSYPARIQDKNVQDINTCATATWNSVQFF